MECWLQVNSLVFFFFPMKNQKEFLSLPPYLFSFGTLCQEDKFTTSSHRQNLHGCSSLTCVYPKRHESSFLEMLCLNKIALLEVSEVPDINSLVWVIIILSKTDIHWYIHWRRIEQICIYLPFSWPPMVQVPTKQL